MKLPRYRLTTSSVVNLVGAVAIMYLVIMLGQTIKRNYDLGQQITGLNQEVTLLQAKKQQQQYNIQYYNTNSFRDREARAQLGLQLPGENVIIIPHSSASPTPTPSVDSSSSKPAPTRSNFQQWLDFIGGKG